MGPWIPIKDGALDPNALYIFAAKDGTFMISTGSQRDRLLEDYPVLTSYRLFCEPPPDC